MPFQSFRPKSTPAPLKNLLWVLFLTSLLSALAPPLQALLSLSLPGLSHGFVWQLFTYPFAATAPFSFGSLIGLAFIIYLFWSIGGLVMKHVSFAPFFRFFFVTSACIGLLTMACSLGLDAPRPLAGASPLVYALLIAMISFGADTNLVLLMMVPFRTKTLILSLMAFNIALDLSAGEWVFALSNIFGVGVSYFYCLLVWDLRGPFVTLRPIEGQIAALGKGARRALRIGESGYGRSVPKHSPEQEAEDAAFLERMLSKIAEGGPDALSLWEKWKIRRVTKRRKGR